MAEGFHLAEDHIALPKGAYARTHRRTLRYAGRPVLGLTQGRHRPYLFPVFTPAGYSVTSECPADHPHHNSFWIAADHVHARMPVGECRHEDYTYNFYLDETFQGRAPGSLVVRETQTLAAGSPQEIIILQDIEWRGPAEWAAPTGRLVAREARRLTLRAEDTLYRVDVESRLRATDWEFTLGPTRHAYFNVRVADSMIVPFGGIVRDDHNNRGGETITGNPARWVDFSGPVGGGHVAGLSVFPDPRDHPDVSWFVADWGVVTVGPFRLKQRLVRQGEEVVARYRVLVHDGDAEACDVGRRYGEFIAEAYAI